MIRILTLIPYPIEGASPRFRAYAYKEPLREHGIDLDIHPFMTRSVFHAWMSSRRLTPPTLVGLGRAACARVVTALKARRYDVIWIQRQTAPALRSVFDELFIRSGVPIVFDMDDAVFLEYPIEHLLRASHATTVGNRHLARYAETVAPRTRTVVVPTVLDMRVYQPTAHRTDDPPVVGWIGTKSSFERYLEPMLAPIAQTCREHGAVLEVVASDGERAATEAVGGRFVPWSLEGERSALRHFDIGIMPLFDDAYARGKCAFKLIEYGAVGIASVGSRVGANSEVIEHGVTGLLANGTEEFQRQLAQLIHHPELRDNMGSAARKRVASRYSVQSQTPVLADLFRQLAGTSV